MEKNFLDEIYTETLESVIAEKMLKENEIEEFWMDTVLFDEVEEELEIL